MLDQVLSTAEDIVVLGKTKDKIAFAFPFKGDIAKNYFDKTVSNAEENKVDGFNRHWKFDNKTRLIKGSSTLLALRLDEKTRQDGLWIPTPEQAMILDEKGKLSNGVYRDFGMAVYSEASPNQEVAKEIISQSKSDLPLVIPFKALTHRLDENFPYGVAIAFTDATGIKSGKQATELLDKFNYKGNSGACRLDRYRYGSWDASWDDLDDSDSVGRVDWMCCEATRAELTSAYQELLKRQYETKIQKLTTERDEKQANFEKSLK
jgi:hypothetical protein